jgi:tetratricopeptide (TPR) repeat protein
VGQFNLGLAYDYNSKFDDALRVYEAAAKLQPNDAPTRNNVGRIYLKRNRLDEAIAQFREALKIDPDFIDAHNNMGLALTEKAIPKRHGTVERAYRQRESPAQSDAQARHAR